MNIHEYQAKELLAKFGVPVPAGHAAMSVEEAVEAAATTPRSRAPPTATGLPRNSGLSRCSTDA